MSQVLTEKTLKSGIANPSQPGLGQCLFVGVDVHKDQHSAVAINCFGQLLLKTEVANSLAGFDRLTEQVKRIAQENKLTPVFGLEDVSEYGLSLAHYLAVSGFEVKSVSPVLVLQLNQYETHPEKSDFLDALGVAKVLIQRIDSLPDFSISETSQTAKEIKNLISEREFLVKEQTRLKNQLHRRLHQARGSEYRERFKSPFTKKALAYWRHCPLSRNNHYVLTDLEFLKKQIRRKIKRLLVVQKEIKEIQEELKVLVAKTGQKLETLNGCGLVSAACLLAEIKNIERFASPSALAKYGGFCPREKSSGKKKKHLKTKSGNRKLNKAVHLIALAQIGHSGNQTSKAYFVKKVAEGKSKAHALCCLKRRLIEIIFLMMKYKQEYRYPR